MPASSDWPERDRWIDERGHRCPAPVIALARASRTAPAGSVLVVIADDPAAEFDIPAWCRMTGHEYAGSVAIETGIAYAARISAG